MTTTISTLRPLNRSLANANPASEVKNSTDAVTTPETMVLLISEAAK
jgi:hypothetical protein